MPTSTVRLKTAIYNRLVANLPALVTAAGLPRIQKFSRHDVGLGTPEQAPQVWVSVAGSRRDVSGTQGSTMQRYAHMRRVLVGIAHASDASAADAESAANTAADELESYVDLIRQCVEGDQTAGGEAHPPMVRFVDADYSPNLAEATGRLFQGCLLAFDIPKHVIPGND